MSNMSVLGVMSAGSFVRGGQKSAGGYVRIPYYPGLFNLDSLCLCKARAQHCYFCGRFMHDLTCLPFDWFALSNWFEDT